MTSEIKKIPGSKHLKRWLAILLVSSVGFTSSCTKSSSGGDDLLLLFLFLFFFNQNQCTLLTATASSPPASDGAAHNGAHLSGAYGEYSPTLNTLPAGPLKTGLFELPGGPQWIRYYEKDGVAIFGGDMRIPMSKQIDPSQFDSAVQRSVGIASSSTRWPTQVSFQFLVGGNAIADETDVRNAMAHWEQYTNFRFVARTAEATWMSFQADGTGCYSFVGMVKTGAQEVNVDANCGFGAAVHEIGHALGLFHEQSRSDRDAFVTIDFSNIQGGFASNYDIASGASDLGQYDVGSIMHYGSYFFAADSSRPVMTRKDGSIISPNRTALTQCDVNGVKSMYGF